MPSNDSDLVPPSPVVPGESSNPPCAWPQRLENLEPPYSHYPHINIQLAPYDENALHGLGIRHLRPNAVFVFERWTVTELFDYFAIYLGDLTNAAADGVVWDKSLDFQYLSVPEEQVPEGEVLIYGLVQRTGSQTPSTSPPRLFLLKTTRPGGDNTNGDEKWHSGLVMSVEGFADGSTIRREDIELGLCCLIEPYEHIRHNDEIQLLWNGRWVTHTVSPAEALGAGPVRVHVPKSVIEAGGELGMLTLRFRVQDVVENFSGERYQYSKPYFLNAELDPNLLLPPFFFVDGEELLTPWQIDFDTQSEAVFEVLALTVREVPVPNPRNQIVVTLLGTLADGTTKTFVSDPVIDSNFGFTYIPVPNAVIGELVGGSFRVSFAWQTAGGVEKQRSGSLTITVDGTPVMMPAVTVSPIELGLIPAGEALTVTLPPYEPHNPSWLETLYITHTPPGGGNAVVYKNEQLAGPQGGVRIISADEMAPLNGLGHINIFYEVNDGRVHALGGSALTIRQSGVLGAQVGDRVADMPRARLQGAIGNNVNPVDVVGPEVLVTFPYLGTLPGDTLHWSCTGSGEGGSDSGVIEINGGNFGIELPYPVERRILDRNLNGSLNISYSLERPGPPRVVMRSEVARFTVGAGVELDLPVIVNASVTPPELNPTAALNGTEVIARFRPMRANDHIYFDWLSIDGLGSVQKDAPGNPATNEARVTIQSRTIAQGIREGGNTINVQYRFHRGSFPYASLIVPLHLLPLTGLPTPRIDGIDGPVLDLSQLNPTARTRISVWPFIHQNQRMWMTYSGIYAENDAPFTDPTYTADLVTLDGETNGINPPTPVDELKKLKDGSRLTIEFWVSLAESLDKNTAILFGVREHIIQALPSVLPHPFINGASGTGPDVMVEPLSIENNTTVTVSYPGMRDSDQITFVWVFADGTSEEAETNGLDGGTVVFNLTTAKMLHRSVNSTVQLKYSIVRTGVADPIPSHVQTVRVNTIPLASLPSPLINSIAGDGVVNLNDFSGNASIAVAKWPLSATGQRIWFTCSSAGVADQVFPPAGHVVTPAQAENGVTLPNSVSRTWLQALPDNQLFTVQCDATFDGRVDQAGAVTFPLTNYTVRTLPAIIMDERTLDVNLKGWLLQNFGFTDLAYTGAAGRKASGGSGALTYRSTNTSAVTVDSRSGRLTFTGTGSATITVSDSANQSKSYLIRVTGGGRICRLYGYGAWQTVYDQITSTGASMLRYDSARSLHREFGKDFPHAESAWLNEGVPPSSPATPYSAHIRSGRGLNYDEWSANSHGLGIF